MSLFSTVDLTLVSSKMNSVCLKLDVFLLLKGTLTWFPWRYKKKDHFIIIYIVSGLCANVMVSPLSTIKLERWWWWWWIMSTFEFQLICSFNLFITEQSDVTGQYLLHILYVCLNIYVPLNKWKHMYFWKKSDFMIILYSQYEHIIQAY